MGSEGTVIETGVDKLVNLIKERGKIALSDSAKELGVSTSVIQEWADFLEEEGIISVEYNLTKPYLVERKLSKKEVDAKAKDFSNQKEVFIRKAEVSLSFLQKQAEDLKKIKGEFDSLKNELGIELDSVREDLKELEKYNQMKLEMQKDVKEQKSNAKNKMDDLVKDISREQKRYIELVDNVSKEKKFLVKEKNDAKSIEESEKLLNKKLQELKLLVSTIEKKVSNEDLAIKNSEEHIQKLNQMMEEIKQHVNQGKETIAPLVQKSEEQSKKFIEMQQQIIKKLAKKQKEDKIAKQVTKKISSFFEKKMVVSNLVDKVNHDRDELEKSLIDLIRRAKSFQLTAKNSDVGKEMADIEKKFNEVNQKKGIFEGELKKLSSFFKV